MTLIVENKDINLSFILYLKKKMFSYLISILNVKRLEVYDEYFNSGVFDKHSNDVIISSRKVIMLGMRNLVHKEYESNVHIFINPNIYYPGTTLKIVDLCKVINYGTMSVDGYPIFSQTFEHFSKHIKGYLEKCIRGLG